MKEDLVSIIVPVYNVQDYLEECLDSILAQTYKNIEIIIIDDGSTDDSGKICEEYNQKYSVISLYRQNNQGLSVARNVGVRYANGKKILFVDSDDYINQNHVGRLMSLSQKYEADIVVGHVIPFWDDITTSEVSASECGIAIWDNRLAMKALIEDKLIKSFAVCKMFDVNLFENLEFPKGKLFEDIAIMHEIFGKAKKVVVTNEPLYFYRQRRDSSSNLRSKKANRDQFEAYLRRISYVQNNYPIYTEIAVHEFVKYALSFYCWVIQCGDKEEAVNIRMCLRSYWREVLRSEQNSFRFKMRYLLEMLPFFERFYALKKVLIGNR